MSIHTISNNYCILIEGSKWGYAGLLWQMANVNTILSKGCAAKNRLQLKVIKQFRQLDKKLAFLSELRMSLWSKLRDSTRTLRDF